MAADLERRQRTRELIQRGGLVAVAGADTLDDALLVGILLEGVTAAAADGELAARLRRLGVEWMAARSVAASKDQPELTVRFAFAPLQEVRDGLRGLGLEFQDDVTWRGRADFDTVRRFVVTRGGVVSMKQRAAKRGR